MIKLTQEHLEALLDKFGGEHNPPSIYLEVGGTLQKHMLLLVGWVCNGWLLLVPPRPTRSTPASWTPCSRGSSSCWRPWATAPTSPAPLLRFQRFSRPRWELTRPPTPWLFCRPPPTPAAPTLAPPRSPSSGSSCPTNRERWYVAC